MLALRRSLPRTIALARPAATQAAARSVSVLARSFERTAQPSLAPLAKFAGQQVTPP